jgi:hypothetical protein
MAARTSPLPPPPLLACRLGPSTHFHRPRHLHTPGTQPDDDAQQQCGVGERWHQGQRLRHTLHLRRLRRRWLRHWWVTRLVLALLLVILQCRVRAGERHWQH